MTTRNAMIGDVMLPLVDIIVSKPFPSQMANEGT
jgi:hypothetical protein